MQLWAPAFVIFACSILADGAGKNGLHDDGGARRVAGSQTTGIEGQVSIGPIRSVEHEGVANHRPYQARIAVLDANGREVASVNSDEQGRFRILLPPASYVVRPEQLGLYPRASAQRVQVVHGQMTHLDIVYDSGKR
jgi:hypothetical protein